MQANEFFTNKIGCHQMVAYKKQMEALAAFHSSQVRAIIMVYYLCWCVWMIDKFIYTPSDRRGNEGKQTHSHFSSVKRAHTHKTVAFIQYLLIVLYDWTIEKEPFENENWKERSTTRHSYKLILYPANRCWSMKNRFPMIILSFFASNNRKNTNNTYEPELKPNENVNKHAKHKYSIFIDVNSSSAQKYYVCLIFHLFSYTW